MAHGLENSIHSSRVSTTYREYSLKEGVSSESALLFLPGWAMRGDSKALKAIGKHMASVMPDSRIYTLATRPHADNVSPDEEVQEVCKFIESKGIKHVTLMGYSEGATRAISAAAQLQQDSQVQVDGLVLFSAMGITSFENAHVSSALAKAIFLNIPANTMNTIRKNPREWRAFFRGIQTAGGVLWGALEEVGVQKALSSFRRDNTEAGKRNPAAEVITAPVVVVAGAHDTVVRRDRITDVQTIFPKSSHAVLLTAEKFDSHGLPFLQPEKAIRASLHVLSRMRR